MNLFIRKAWRDIKTKKIRSIPIMIIIFIGGIVVVMYGSMLFGWQQVEKEQWDELNHHHMVIYTQDLNPSQLIAGVEQTQDATDIDLIYDLRLFLEMNLLAYQTAESSTWIDIKSPVRVYGINYNNEQRVDQLYYYPNSQKLNSLENPLQNVGVMDYFAAEKTNVSTGDHLSILYHQEIFNITNIGLVGSSEYMLTTELMAQVYNVWEHPILWMHYDYLSNISNQTANQITIKFSNPDQKSPFLEAFMEEIGAEYILKTEGRDAYLSTFTPTMNAMMIIMTIFFSSVSAIMMFFVIKRMIEEEVQTYGLFKALGFTPRELMQSALSYGFMLSLAGSIIGGLLGLPVGNALLNFFFTNVMRVFPNVGTSYNRLILPMLLYSGITVLMTVLGVLISCRKIIKLDPVESMRPRTTFTKVTSTIIERISQKLNISLPPLTSFTLRNSSQQRKKSFLIIFGIMMATVISFFGMSFLTSTNLAMDQSINDFRLWDGQVHFYDYLNSSSIESLVENEEYGGNIIDFEPYLTFPVRSTEDITEIYVLTGIERNSNMRTFEDNKFPTEGQIFLSADVAAKFQINIGDKFEIYDIGGEERNLTVTHITYDMFGKGLYCDRSTAQEIGGISTDLLGNNIYIKVEDATVGFASIQQADAVADITTKENIQEFQETGMQEMQLVMVGTQIAGLAIGIAISVTVVSILISQRKTDFVNFRALGVENKEIFKIIFIELLFNGSIGLLLGLGGGTILIRRILEWASVFGMNFPPTLASSNYIVSIGNILLGIIFASYLSLRKLFKTTIAESTVSRIIG